MDFRVVVKLRATKENTVYGPEMGKDEAEQQLLVIRETLGMPRRPDLPWLAVQGKDVVGAHLQEFVLPSLA